MIYLIFGSLKTRVRKQVNKIIDSIFNDEERNIEVFDYENRNIFTVLDECNSLSLTSFNKVVELDNCYFLTQEKCKKKISDNEKKELIEYIKNPSDSANLILTVLSNKINVNNEIYKELLNNGKVIEIKEIQKKEWPIFIKMFFDKKKIKITSEALNEFINRIDEDYDRFLNESQKLLIYKENNITLDDVKAIVSKPIDENVFDLVNNLLSGNKDKVISIYKDFKILNVQPVMLINLLTTNLSFLNKVHLLREDGNDESDIIRILKANPYQVKIALNNLRKIKYERIEKALDDLFELDRKIKHSEIDPLYGFELFLINF